MKEDEITLKIDESRVITINIYIPIFDEEYDFHLDLRKASISKDDLEKDLAFEIERLDKLEGEAKTADQDDIISKINDLRSSPLLQEIRSSIEASGGDAVAANKGQSRLLEFKIQVDAIETLVHWPSITAKIQDWLKDLKALAADHGNPSQKQKASDLSSQVEDAIRRKDADIIEPGLNRINTTGDVVAGALPLLYTFAEGIVRGATYAHNPEPTEEERKPNFPAMGTRRSRLFEGVGVKID